MILNPIVPKKQNSVSQKTLRCQGLSFAIVFASYENYREFNPSTFSIVPILYIRVSRSTDHFIKSYFLNRVFGYL